MNRFILALAAAFNLIAATAAQAAAPDAGQLLREQQPQRQIPGQLPRFDGEKERAPLVDSGARVDVNGFTFKGYEGLATESELQALVANSVGKKLSFIELKALAEKVTAFLKEKGWFLARAYLPQQDVTTGLIEIDIIQGKSDGSLLIKRDKTARVAEATVSNILLQAVRSGRALNEQDFERSVLLVNDLPGITAKASLAAGSVPGSTGVKVDVSEGPLLSGALWGDNEGNRYTGTWRGNVMLNLNDPLAYGDQLSLLVVGAEGLMQGKVGYTFPLTSSGLKGNLAYTRMHYKLIGDMASLDSDGDSDTLDAALSYPILRSRITNVTTTLGYSFKALSDNAANTETSNKRLHSGTLGFNGDRYDTLIGGGYNTWNASVTIGHLDERVADISITNSEGEYTRFNFGLVRLQKITEKTSLNLSWAGQSSLDNLNSSEKFNLGGPSGVRAYPVGEASGDEGHLFNVELRYNLPVPAPASSLQLSAFYDFGQIKLHKFPWANSVVTATDNNRYWLQGAGLGATYAYNKLFSLKTSWAHTVGDNPGRTVNGQNSDGKNNEDRFWLQGMIFF